MPAARFLTAALPRRNCWCSRTKTGRTDETTVGFGVNGKMGVNIKNHNLEHTDRLGKKQSSRTKPRPVFVKFVRYNDRRKVFSIKK